MKQYSLQEERWNCKSHILGVLLGVIAGPFLLFQASNASEPIWAIVTVGIYLMGMLSSYIASSLYHATTYLLKKKQLRKFDHAAIYLHIAGTYTPFTLLVLRGESYWGWGLFLFVWLTAIIGILFNLRKQKKHNYIETGCYIIMGTSILVAFKTLWHVLELNNNLVAFYWLIGGGIAFVIGAIFYSVYKVKYMHTIFHLFVLIGSICHIIAIASIL